MDKQIPFRSGVNCQVPKNVLQGSPSQIIKQVTPKKWQVRKWCLLPTVMTGPGTGEGRGHSKWGPAQHVGIPEKGACYS